MQLDNSSYFKFSGGEVHTKVHNGISNITMKDYTMDGFMALAEIVETSRRNYGKNHSIKVCYPYFPYARQDRVMQRDEPFSLKIFCSLLNSLDLTEVIVYDPHSDVTPALINNCYVVPQHKLVKKIVPLQLLQDHNVIIVSPDAGAYKKVSKLTSDDTRIALGSKYRNSKGEITRTGISFDGDLTGKICLIVDDICDGGRTFIELAKVLKDKGAKEVHLYVTHGIFSKGLNVLEESGITKIYTTSSFTRIPFEPITILHVFNIPEQFHDID